MLMDDGIAIIWRNEQKKEPGKMPKESFSEEFFSSYYGEKTVGVTRRWMAKTHDDNADVLIEIQRNAKITTEDRCELIPNYDSAGAAYYRIIQIQQVTDEDGQPMTDLTLERIDALDEP